MNINNLLSTLAQHGGWGLAVVALFLLLWLGRRWMNDINTQRNYRHAMKSDDLARRHALVTSQPAHIQPAASAPETVAKRARSWLGRWRQRRGRRPRDDPS